MLSEGGFAAEGGRLSALRSMLKLSHQTAMQFISHHKKLGSTLGHWQREFGVKIFSDSPSFGNHANMGMAEALL